jgi:hypothetical protein
MTAEEAWLLALVPQGSRFSKASGVRGEMHSQQKGGFALPQKKEQSVSPVPPLSFK